MRRTSRYTPNRAAAAMKYPSMSDVLQHRQDADDGRQVLVRRMDVPARAEVLLARAVQPAQELPHLGRGRALAGGQGRAQRGEILRAQADAEAAGAGVVEVQIELALVVPRRLQADAVAVVP